MKAYLEGLDAYNHGESREANPHPIGAEREDWFDGWDWAKDYALKAERK